VKNRKNPDPAEIQSYIDHYPQGKYVDEARRLLKALQPPPAPPPPEPVQPPPPAEPTRVMVELRSKTPGAKFMPRQHFSAIPGETWEVAASKEGCQTLSKTITVKLRDNVFWLGPLQCQQVSALPPKPPPSPPPLPHAFSLTVEATPSDSTITILGLQQKYYPGIALAPGSYNIRVARDGYVTVEASLKIRHSDVVIPITLTKSEPLPPLSPQPNQPRPPQEAERVRLLKEYQDIQRRTEIYNQKIQRHNENAGRLDEQRKHNRTHEDVLRYEQEIARHEQEGRLLEQELQRLNQESKRYLHLLQRLQ
jgi:hypothetical protein